MKPKLLLVCHIPPPVHGASVMGLHVSQSARLRAAFDVETIPIQINPEGVGGVHRFSAAKVFKSAAIGLRLANALLRRRPDLVYMAASIAGFSFIRDLVFASMVRMAGARIVYHLHMRGVESRFRSSRLHRAGYRWLFRNADVIHLSERLYADVACVVPRERFHVVQNGIAGPPPSTTQAAPEDAEPRILFLSNLHLDKGPLELLHACRRLREDGVPHRLVFAGDAADAAVTKEIAAAQADATQKVEWVGPAYGEEKTRLLASAAVFVFPSYYRFEVQPLSLMEAMALGVPVVTSDLAAIPDMVRDGVEGLLVEPRDVTGLSQAVRRLLQDDNLRRRMGSAARQRYLDCFTLEAFETRLVETLQTIISRRGGADA